MAVDTGLARLVSKGEQRIFGFRAYIYDLAADRDGNVFALTDVPYVPSQNALLSKPCPYYGFGYVRYSPDGTPLFFTYLPVQLSGNTNGVLVERSEFDESPTAAAHRRAYIRI